MSSILRSSLRLVNTAKYAKNNSTQYFRTMAPPNNNFNASLALYPPDDLSKSVRLLNTQAELKPKSRWEWLMIVFASEIFGPNLPEKKTLSSILGSFIVSQSSGTMEIIVNNNRRYPNIFLPTVFTTELNGTLVKPTSDTIASEEKEPRYFVGRHGLNFKLDGDKLEFKFDNIDETFIVSQAVHVKAFNDPAQIQKNGDLKILTRLDLDDLRAYDAKLTFKTPTGGESRTYRCHCRSAPPKQWDGFGDYGLMEITKKTAAELNPAAVAEYPGRVKLQFPIDLSLQGFKHVIKIKETGETFEVCHTVNIKVLKESGDKIKYKESKNPEMDVLIQSGDINLHSLDGYYQEMCLRFEVLIRLTYDNQMYIAPITKQKAGVEKNLIIM